jgi:excisionase family DNA binding protein
VLGVGVPDPEEEGVTDVVFTVTELCARWKASRRTVLDAIRDGRLKGFRLGARNYRVTLDEVLRYEREAA